MIISLALKIKVPLPQPPQYKDYKRAPTHFRTCPKDFVIVLFVGDRLSQYIALAGLEPAF